MVLDLRVRFPEEPRDLLGLPWLTTRNTLKPDEDDFGDMGAVFAVPGRSAERRFVEFGAPWPGFPMLGRVFQVRVEARFDNKPEEWTELLSFSLHTEAIVNSAFYITHSNRPREVSAEDMATVDAAVEDLVAQMGDKPQDVGRA